jgi:hypothetical protein
VLFRRLTCVAVAAVSLSACAAGPAWGAIYSGAKSDPADQRDRSVDVRRIATTFDSSTGLWRVTVTFAKDPTSATRARIYLSFRVQSLGQCHVGTMDEGGPFLQTDVRGQAASAIYYDNCLPPSRMTGSAQRSGRTVTVSMTDPRLIGVVPTTFNQTRVSWRNHPFDYVPAFPLTLVASSG